MRGDFARQHTALAEYGTMLAMRALGAVSADTKGTIEVHVTWNSGDTIVNCAINRDHAQVMVSNYLSNAQVRAINIINL